MKSKLVIGTANFGQRYGISKKKTKLSFNNIKKILNYANKHDVKKLDTATVYGNTEKILGKLNLKKNEIYTKLPKLPKNCRNISQWVFKNIKNSSSLIKTKKINGIFLHHAEDLLSENKRKLYVALQEVKKKGLVEKIGVSIYSFKTLEKILKEFKFDIVQIPFNIFDRRLEHFKFFNKLKKKKIEIYVRSIFLKGALLLKEKKVSKNFYKWKSLFKLWNSWLADNKVTNLQACINYVFSFKEVDKIIIGVNSLKQTKEIFNAVENKTNLFPKNLFSNDENLINPNKWKKK